MTDINTSGPSCSLDARTFQQRIAAIADLNRRALVGLRRTGRALTLNYRPDALEDIKSMVADERECCSFLDFRATATMSGIELIITVPEDHADNADALLAPFDGTEAKAAEGDSCCGACQ